MKTVVFGANGQVGRALLEILGSDGLGLGRNAADLSTPDTLPAILDRLGSQFGIAAVINGAAYTAVDLAEKEEPLAQIINGQSPAVLARWCASRQIPFVHYSTDYVFSGQGQKPWSEEDPVAPLNAYGRTKLAGEQTVTTAGGDFLIFRTSWVYDAFGSNFVRTMLRLGAERPLLRVVADQFGAPTYAPQLARATLEGLKRARELPAFPSGIYNLSAAGETSWHAFASEIFARARTAGLPLAVHTVEAIPSSAYPTPARRPGNSRLNLAKVARILGQSMPDWKDGLAACIDLLKKEPL